jgi:tRNA pseudouridine55 synthase
MSTSKPEGILLVDKPVGITSFGLVARLRKLLNVQKIGHAGTLDPFATGVMVMLVGRNYTKLSDTFLCQDKEYRAVLKLGEATDSYDCEGQITASSDIIPSHEALLQTLEKFQGTIQQTPPMFSAKKVGGKKLYELARKGQEIERQSVQVSVAIKLISYDYPFVTFDVACSKGTYIRSLAHDIGSTLGCGGHLTQLRRTRSGAFQIDNCLNLEKATLSEVISSLHNSH